MHCAPTRGLACQVRTCLAGQRQRLSQNQGQRPRRCLRHPLLHPVRGPLANSQPDSSFLEAKFQFPLWIVPVISTIQLWICERALTFSVGTASLCYQYGPSAGTSAQLSYLLDRVVWQLSHWRMSCAPIICCCDKMQTGGKQNLLSLFMPEKAQHDNTQAEPNFCFQAALLLQASPFLARWPQHWNMCARTSSTPFGWDDGGWSWSLNVLIWCPANYQLN